MSQPWPVAKRAADLPPGHLESFVWHYCWRAGFSLAADLDEFSFMGSDCAGRVERKFPDAPEHALLGTDGLYHLARGRGRVCRGMRFPGPRSGDQHPKIAPDAVPVPLIEVPRAMQCVTERNTWPGGSLSGSKLSPVRRRLVDHFGPGCAVCSNPWAAVVDHDHLTGLVRGYLCRDCNGGVDACRHLEGCPCAAYLVNPPALSLGVLHPDKSRWLRQEKYVARQACFDLVMRGEPSPGHGLQPTEDGWA